MTYPQYRWISDADTRQTEAVHKKTVRIRAISRQIAYDTLMTISVVAWGVLVLWLVFIAFVILKSWFR